ncbi:MAG: PP2C family serine/threonine-protein phosphatase [Steroidobacteraceae bacterium]
MWRVFCASATGQRNLEQGAPGQDASHYIVMDDVLVAVVCDGAGSVCEGRTGSDFIARALAEELANTVHADPSLCEVRAVGPARLEATIRCAIGAVRARLEELAASRQLVLHDFSCTLVGCVASPRSGCFFQIGDGFAIQQAANGDSALSHPENGEYADETYFVTDENWKDHLRHTPLPAPEAGTVIGLMSDGTAPFAVNRARSGFFRPFIDPIVAFLRESTAANGNAALRNLLESPRACEISSDDKTLLLALVL